VSFESKMSNNINYPFWKNRYIYIFLGLPNTGKTYISNSLGLNVFKTDNYSNLPNYIEEDIVIIGKNKIYDIDIDIIPRFRGNCYFTFVEFDFI
jgi:GTPase SAR1 family protein